MTELSKLVSSLLLVGAGFFAASLFGPPDLMERLSQRFRPASGQSTSWLQPIASAEPSGPPLRDPTQSVRPLPPLPQSVPSVAAIRASHPQADTSNMPPATAEANDWFNNAAGDAWPSASAGISNPPAVTAPLEPTPSTEPWPAAESPEPDTSDPWGEPWPASQTRAPMSDAAAFGTPSMTPAPATTPLQEPYAAAKPVTSPPRPHSAAPLTTHIVTDGDTLSRLAQRYLGDAARANQLFELNNDRLESAELLPIGVVLRVPDEPKPQQATLTPPTATRSPFAPQTAASQGMLGAPQAAPSQAASSQYASVGYTDGPSLVSPPAPLEHRASRLVPVGDPAEAAPPVPTINQSTGPAYTPRTIDEWQW